MAKAKAPAAPAKPKAPSTKSKVDYGAVLMQHGERAGLIVAGVLCGLLVVTGLFWPGSGFLAENPDVKAKVLETQATAVSSQLASARPTEADLPPTVGPKARLALDTTQVKGNSFMLATLIPPYGEAGGLGRRKPDVYAIDEAVAGVGRVQMKSYIFDPKFTSLRALETGGDEKNPSLGLKGLGKRLRPGSGGSPLGGMGAGMGAGMGSAGMLGLPGTLTADGEKKPKRDVWLPLDTLEKRSNYVPALQIRPLRVAVIAATFPYKKQVEEFRTKLAMRSVNEVLSEGMANQKASETPLAAFRFLGVEVERRELDGDGKPKGEWAALNVAEEYRKWIALSGREFEADTGEYAKLMVPGLAMPKLKQFRASEVAAGGAAGTMPGGMGERPGAGGPPPRAGGAPPMPGGGLPMPGGMEAPVAEEKSQYPAVESELKNLAKAIEGLKAKPTTAVGLPGRFSGADTFDPFNPPAAPTSATPGTATGDLPPVLGSTEDPTGMGKGVTDKPLELPEHCLVRIIDVTIQPGRAYEYRTRVKMANPNQGRRDVASPTYATPEKLEGPWSEMPIRVRVEPELYYYAVDQKTLDAAENPRNPYQGPYRLLEVKPTMLMLQAHRWLTETKLNTGATLIVGEWSVVERFPVFKGEYVGRQERARVPVWRYNREEFTLPNDHRNPKLYPGIEVDFGYAAKGPTNQPEAILLDFEQGRQSYERVVGQAGDKVDTKRATDDMGVQALMVNPDGRVVLLEGAVDAADEAREKRVTAVRKRVREVEKKSTPAGGGTPFGGGTPAGDS